MGADVSQTVATSVDTETAHVGRRIRQQRLVRGLSARELAARAQLTAAYVSRLENGKVSPTVATLSRLVQAMGETMTSLFADTNDTGSVVRAAQRTPVRSGGVQDFRVTPSWTKRLEVLESIVEPDCGSGPSPHTHPGEEECVLVLDGELTVWIDGETWLLGRGDAATFYCASPHRWHNSGASPSRVLWMITPAVY
jgi:transcriptional regulator with XRE-family HTH domain